MNDIEIEREASRIMDIIFLPNNNDDNCEYMDIDVESDCNSLDSIRSLDTRLTYIDDDVKRSLISENENENKQESKFENIDINELVIHGNDKELEMCMICFGVYKYHKTCIKHIKCHFRQFTIKDSIIFSVPKSLFSNIISNNELFLCSIQIQREVFGNSLKREDAILKYRNIFKKADTYFCIICLKPYKLLGNCKNHVQHINTNK